MSSNNAKRKGTVESKLRPRGLVVSTHLSVLPKCICSALVLLTQVPKVLLLQGQAVTVVISLPPFVVRKRPRQETPGAKASLAPSP